MYRTTNALLLAALLSSACEQQQNPGMNVEDGGVITPGQDLVGTTPVLGQVEVTTIRDLNSDKFPAGTHVQVGGVMQSPVTAAYAVEFNKSCLYEMVVVQADPSPTLKDGMVVRYIKRNVSPSGMITSALCQQMVTGKIALNDNVTVKGTLVVNSGIHSIDLGALGSVASSGPAQTVPQPVVISSSQLASAPFNSPLVAAFAGASGALVSLQNVVTTESHAATVTFKVSATPTDASRTRISTEYLRIANPSYVPAGDGTTYAKVTGVVSIDLGGTVLLRTAADLQ